jgi:hypothetical protein
MQDQRGKAFDSTADAAKQLLTVAAGVLALTITFVKDILQDDPGHWLRLVLLASWIAFFLSLVCGILVLGAVAGELETGLDAPAAGGAAAHVPTTAGRNIAIPMWSQFGTFVLGAALLVVFGSVAFWDYAPASSTTPTSTPTVVVNPTHTP